MAKDDVYLLYNGPADVLDLRPWTGKPDDDRYVFTSSRSRAGSLTPEQAQKQGRPVKFTAEEALELRTIPTYEFSVVRSDVAEAILEGKPLPGRQADEPTLEPAIAREYTKAEVRAAAQAAMEEIRAAGPDGPTEIPLAAPAPASAPQGGPTAPKGKE
jgi:hypothetical protein